MFEVICPECETLRMVKARKPWMIGDQPYQKICKSCCQAGKEKSDEHKAKLSQSVKAAQTLELLVNKSQYRKDHPELWQGNLVAGAGAGWNKGMTLPELSDETKQKISNTMKQRKNKDNEPN